MPVNETREVILSYDSEGICLLRICHQLGMMVYACLFSQHCGGGRRRFKGQDNSQTQSKHEVSVSYMGSCVKTKRTW